MPPKDSELLSRIETLAQTQESLHGILKGMLARSTAELDSIIFEFDQSQPNTTQSNTGFRAQTNDTEVIEGVFITLPSNNSTGTLTLGDIQVPLVGQVTFLRGLKWVIRSQTRTVTCSNPSASQGIQTIIWGHAAPGLVPGVLHA